MVCVFTNTARNIQTVQVIETRGFYKEKIYFIYSVGNVETIVKKSH